MLLKNRTYIKSKKSLLDTSALIALLKKEPGYEIIEGLIANSAISSVNLSELVSIMARNDVIDSEIIEVITDLVPEVLPFTESIAIQAGILIKHTKSLGLSLGDRACIATGLAHNMTIYTTDRIWEKLDISANIIVIR